MIDDNSDLLITVFVQELDLNIKMDKGLINTNQCKSFGFQRVDNPTDITRKLIFYANNIFLPLHSRK